MRDWQTLNSKSKSKAMLDNLSKKRLQISCMYHDNSQFSSKSLLMNNNQLKKLDQEARQLAISISDHITLDSWIQSIQTNAKVFAVSKS